METTWDSLANSIDNRFLSLKPGPNNMRILSEKPYIFKKHYFEASKRSVICPNDSSCIPCQLGMQSSERFAVVVLDLDTNQVKILDQGKKVRKSIVALHQRSIWGDPRGYDLTIEKSGSGLQTDYSVVPGLKQALTEAQIAEAGKQIREKNLQDLSQVIKPTPVEKVRELLGEVKATSPVPASKDMPSNPSPVPQNINLPSKDRLMNTSNQDPNDLFKSLGLKK